MRTLDITVSVTGAWEGKLNKRRKEVKVQNREGRGKETEDESDKSVGEKDVWVFNEHNYWQNEYHFNLPSLSVNTAVCRSLHTPGD